MPDVFAMARAEGRKVLLETEASRLLAEHGFTMPHSVEVSGPEEAVDLDLDIFPGDRVVLKAVSPTIAHKSDVGAVAVGTKGGLVDALHRMRERLHDQDVHGFTVTQYVPHDPGLGGELLLGARWTHDFGPVVTLGVGGIHTEHIASALAPAVATATLSAYETDQECIQDALHRCFVTPLVTGGLRGQKGTATMDALLAAWDTMAALAREHMPHDILEVEANPVVSHGGHLMPLDALVRLGDGVRSASVDRPLKKLQWLLRPKSIGIIGVSSGGNPGRTILNNLFQGDFPGDIHIIKPGHDELDGVPCHASIAAMPPVDLFVVAVDSTQVPAVLTDLADHGKSHAAIVIPGGFEEKAGSEDVVAAMHAALTEARKRPDGGLLVNGGNCVGIRSRPGRYDTIFIPKDRLRPATGPVDPVALVSQSGALGCAFLNRLQHVNPAYVVSIGNQMDLTAADYLEHLAREDETDLLAFYLEGFRPGDGLRFMQAAETARAAGKTVLLYLAGRSEAGAQAMVSHTAAVASDQAIARHMATRAGVTLAGSLQEFEDLVRTHAALRRRPLQSDHVAMVSNAGFECVAMADNLGPLRPAMFSPATEERLKAAFRRARIDGIVDVHDPLDLTPMMDDTGYEEVMQSVLEDEGVDAVVVGIVPMTPALASLEDGGPDGIGSRLARIVAASDKPVLAVVAGGHEYASLRETLEGAGVVTFESADRAMQTLARAASTLSARPEAPRTAVPIPPL